jgi:uracil-DNA glycosylase
MLSNKIYSEELQWANYFVDSIVSFDDIPYHKSWNKIFDIIKKDKRLKKLIYDSLSKEIQNNKNIIIHPSPRYLFNAFNLTSLKKLKVIIIGQDPYFDHEIYNNKIVSQAMGLSFSVPIGIKIPSSLKNIYSNLKKFNHIKSQPEHGNLENWASQGCLLLNTSLTVIDGNKNKNCHQSLWSWFTDEIITYISTNKNNVIFVLWGAHALKKSNIINTDKHKLLISSHPSGLSAGNKLGEYPSFNSFDHFGEINKILKDWDKSLIDWNLSKE